jgi:isocitrate dehydrogenase (NAD+)
VAYEVTFIPGDGTGPELAEATRRALEATGVEFAWDVQQAGIDEFEQTGNPLPAATLASLRRTKVGIKGPTTTPGRLGLPLGQRRVAQAARSVRLPAAVQGLRRGAHALPRPRHGDRAREHRGPLRRDRVRAGQPGRRADDRADRRARLTVRADSGISIKPISVFASRSGSSRPRSTMRSATAAAR